MSNLILSKFIHLFTYFQVIWCLRRPQLLTLIIIHHTKCHLQFPYLSHYQYLSSILLAQRLQNLHPQSVLFIFRSPTAWLITAHLENVTLERQFLCFPRRSCIHGSTDYCWYCKHHSIWLNLCNDSSILCQIHLHENEQSRSQILVSIDINSNFPFF